MTRTDFDRILCFLEGAFGAELSDKQRDAWWLLLQAEAAAMVMQRAVAYARSERARYGLPKPGDLLEQDETETRSLVAWHTLVLAIEDHDAYQSVVFDDTALSATVAALGGWGRVCDWPTADGKEMRFIQREFERLYRELARCGATGPGRHVGVIEAHNAGRFDRHVPEPVRIGPPGNRHAGPPRLPPAASKKPDA